MTGIADSGQRFRLHHVWKGGKKYIRNKLLFCSEVTQKAEIS